MSYNYMMSVRAYKNNVELTDEIISAIRNSIDKANNKSNAINKGYKFEILERIDKYKIKIHLSSKVSVQGTRALASVTTSLVHDYPHIAEKIKVNKNVFKAKIIDSGREDFSNIEPGEVVKAVIDIYMLKNDKKAREYQEKIKNLIVSYKEESSSR